MLEIQTKALKLCLILEYKIMILNSITIIKLVIMLMNLCLNLF